MLQLMVCDIARRNFGLRRGREIDSFWALPCLGIIGYGLFIRDLTEYDILDAPAVCRLNSGTQLHPPAQLCLHFLSRDGLASQLLATPCPFTPIVNGFGSLTKTVSL